MLSVPILEQERGEVSVALGSAVWSLPRQQTSLFPPLFCCWPGVPNRDLCNLLSACGLRRSRLIQSEVEWRFNSFRIGSGWRCFDFLHRYKYIVERIRRRVKRTNGNNGFLIHSAALSFSKSLNETNSLLSFSISALRILRYNNNTLRKMVSVPWFFYYN